MELTKDYLWKQMSARERRKWWDSHPKQRTTRFDCPFCGELMESHEERYEHLIQRHGWMRWGAASALWLERLVARGGRLD